MEPPRQPVSSQPSLFSFWVQHAPLVPQKLLHSPPWLPQLSQQSGGPGGGAITAAASPLEHVASHASSNVFVTPLHVIVTPASPQ